MAQRIAEVHRKTKETDISISINLDGTGQSDVETGVGFFDHMLDQIARHGLMDLCVRCTGDLHIDDHHTVEDTGICLGQALAKALGDKQGISRFGSTAVPLDEALTLVSLDISGRGMLVADLGEMVPRVGAFSTQLVEEFFRAVAASAGITLHIRRLSGANSHHVIEASFKAFARALRAAVTLDERVQGVPSTKGAL